MKTSVVVALLTALWAGPALAAEAEKLYYAGEAKLSDAAGHAMGSQALLVEQSRDPEHGLIVERAIVVKPDGGVEEHTMTMNVSGDAFSLTDDKQTVSGSGKLFGPAWHWTYFKAEFAAGNGVRIEDENFMADPTAVTARKRIAGPDGKVIMYMDVTMKTITPKTFEILRGGLLKK